MTDILSSALLLADSGEPIADTLYRVFLLEAAIREDVLFDETPAKRRKTRSDMAVSAVEMCKESHAYDKMKDLAEKYLATNIFPAAKREIESMVAHHE